MASVPGTLSKTNNISGVVLAGGANKRFGGKIKSNAIIGGEKIIDRIINTISGIFDEIIIVTNNPGEFKQYSEYKITGDHFIGTGPLGGIHSAMKSSSVDAVFIFAGDMPFLSMDLIKNQIDIFRFSHSEALIPLTGSKMEPLHGIYRNSISEKLEKYLSEKQEFAVRKFLEQVDVSFFNPGDSNEVLKAFININSQSDADRVNREYEF
jgi:molybdopterin-guanine dinucleotide biosynthesis protein A